MEDGIRAGMSPLLIRFHDELVLSIRTLRAQLLAEGVEEQVVDRALRASGLEAAEQVPGSSIRHTEGDGEGHDQFRSRSGDRRWPRDTSPRVSRRRSFDAVKSHLRAREHEDEESHGDDHSHSHSHSGNRNHGRSRSRSRDRRYGQSRSGVRPLGVVESEGRFEKFDVTLPDDCVPGQVLLVQSPSGSKFHITVPPSATPGTLLTVNVPLESEKGGLARPRSSKGHRDLPPAPAVVHGDVAATGIPAQGLFGNPGITDASGHMLDASRWKWWVDARVVRVKDLFDHRGDVHNHIHGLVSDNPRLVRELETLCGAVPMAWRDQIHQDYLRGKEEDRKQKSQQPLLFRKKSQDAVQSNKDASPQPDADGKEWIPNPSARGRGK